MDMPLGDYKMAVRWRDINTPATYSLIVLGFARPKRSRTVQKIREPTILQRASVHDDENGGWQIRGQSLHDSR